MNKSAGYRIKMDLTPEQQDLVAQFTSISGAEDEREKVVSLLTVNSWDLNNALSSYFDHGFDMIDRISLLSISGGDNAAISASGPEILQDPAESHLSHRRTSSSAGPELVNLQSQMFLESFRPRLPKAPRISNHWQLELGIHSSLSEKLLHTPDRRPAVNSWWLVLLLVPRTLLLFLVSIFRFLFVGSSSHFIGRFPPQFDYGKYSEDFDFAKSIGYDKEATELSASPDLSQFNIKSSDFNLVLQSAQTGYSWLLVILVDNRTESQDFCKRLFASPEFAQLFNKASGTFKDNVIFVNNVEESPEAYEVGKTYKAKRLPFLCLAANVSNDPSVMASMSTLYKSNVAPDFLGPEQINSTVKKLSENLEKLMESYDPQLIAQRFDQQEIEFARQLKKQQDDAYIQSLEKDRLKKMEKDHQQQVEKTMKEMAQKRETFLMSLIRENWFQSVGDGESKVKIAIKLPNGKRLIETVLKSVTLQQLYLYVETRLYVEEKISDENNEFGSEEAILQYAGAIDQEPMLHGEYYATFAFRFDLIQPYPKKVLDVAGAALGDIPELRLGANLLVEYHEDDEADASAASDGAKDE